MKRTKNIIIILSVYLAACLMLVSQASYAGDAGRAQFVIGSVQITSATGQTSVLKKGDAVKEGDTLTTAQAASAQIKMLDGGLIAVRPDTKLKFDTFIFNGTQDGSERSFFSLFTGGFRAVTGLIGQLHKPNFRITTAAATIGIRGTDHETFVVTAGSPLAAVAPIGTYNKVNRGETTMTSEKGMISVLPNQMGFVGAADQMPELRPLNTKIFTVTDRPLKEAVGDKKEAGDVRETAAVHDAKNKETAVETASFAGKDSNTNTLKRHSKPGKDDPSSTLTSITSVLAVVVEDPVTAINWGHWDGGVKVTNRLTGEVTTLAPGANMPWAAGPTGIAAAQLPGAGANTYTNAVTSSPANSPGNAGTTGSASTGSTRMPYGLQNSGTVTKNMSSSMK